MNPSKIAHVKDSSAISGTDFAAARDSSKLVMDQQPKFDQTQTNHFVTEDANADVKSVAPSIDGSRKAGLFRVSTHLNHDLDIFDERAALSAGPLSALKTKTRDSTDDATGGDKLAK